MIDEQALKEKIGKIRLLISDVDGVMTDGRIIYDNFGDEFKLFDVHDGLAAYLLKRGGIKLVVMTAKGSKLVKRRSKELKAAALYQKAWDKGKVYKKIRAKFRMKDEEICAVGDDLLDVPVFKQVGLAVAVANAVPEAKEAAHYVTQRSGGRGALRELIELLLKTQGKWQKVTARYQV